MSLFFILLPICAFSIHLPHVFEAEVGYFDKWQGDTSNYYMDSRSVCFEFRDFEKFLFSQVTLNDWTENDGVPLDQIRARGSTQISNPELAEFIETHFERFEGFL